MKVQHRFRGGRREHVVAAEKLKVILLSFFYVRGVSLSLLTRLLEVLVCRWCMYWFVVAWEVLHATVSFESHDW
jgi:hypothetical protein